MASPQVSVEHVPYAAWVRNETMTFLVHENFKGVGSSLFEDSVFVREDATKLQVEAIDLAEWMRVHLT